MHLKHVPGIELIADPVTKVLAGPELPHARKKLGMVNLGESAMDETKDVTPVTDKADTMQTNPECVLPVQDQTISRFIDSFQPINLKQGVDNEEPIQAEVCENSGCTPVLQFAEEEC